MPICSKLTPNLIVSSVERSLSFYQEVLGFSRGITVPDESPFVFASVSSGPVEIFFNSVESAVKEYPALDKKPRGLSGTLFIEVEKLEALYEELRERVTVVLPYVVQWYGMKEFAIADPDGYVITFAERV